MTVTKTLKTIGRSAAKTFEKDGLHLGTIATLGVVFISMGAEVKSKTALNFGYALLEGSLIGLTINVVANCIDDVSTANVYEKHEAAERASEEPES